MTWVAAAIGGSAVLGAVSQSENAKAQQRAKKAEMMANAAQIQYSPWTGAKVQVMGNSAADPNGAAVNGALQGGLTGGMMASQFGKGTPAAPPTENPGTAEQQLRMQQMMAPGAGGPNVGTPTTGSPWTEANKPSMYGSQGSPYQQFRTPTRNS